MPRFQVSDFITHVRGRSLARQNRYEVQITNPVATPEEDATTSLLCEISALPEMIIQTKPFRMFGPSHQIPGVGEYGGQGLQMTFHLDRDMMIKRYFDAWMHMVTMPGFFVVNYREVYVRNILITQLDPADNETYTVRLWEAFPIRMQQVDLTHASRDETLRLNVVFAYRYWETEQIRHDTYAGTAPTTDLDPRFVGPPAPPTIGLGAGAGTALGGPGIGEGPFFPGNPTSPGDVISV